MLLGRPVLADPNTEAPLTMANPTEGYESYMVPTLYSNYQRYSVAIKRADIRKPRRDTVHGLIMTARP